MLKRRWFLLIIFPVLFILFSFTVVGNAVCYVAKITVSSCTVECCNGDQQYYVCDDGSFYTICSGGSTCGSTQVCDWQSNTPCKCVTTYKCVDGRCEVKASGNYYSYSDCADKCDEEEPLQELRCFLPDTKITMSDGSYKNIENIEVNDLVKVFNEETKQERVL